MPAFLGRLEVVSGTILDSIQPWDDAHIAPQIRSDKLSNRYPNRDRD
jgi:hypothetical protein